MSLTSLSRHACIGGIVTRPHPISLRSYSARPNIQKPRHPSWFRQKLLAVTKPRFKTEHETTEKLWQNCPRTEEEKIKQRYKEPNALEILYGKELRKCVEGSKMIGFFHYNYTRGEARHIHWQNARRIGMELKECNRRVARCALEGTKWENCLHFFDTSRTNQFLIFSPEVNAAQLVKYAKKTHELLLLAVAVHDRILSREEFQQLARLPAIEDLRAELCSLLEHPQRETLSCLNRNTQELSQRLVQYVKDQSEKEK